MGSWVRMGVGILMLLVAGFVVCYLFALIAGAFGMPFMGKALGSFLLGLLTGSIGFLFVQDWAERAKDW